MERGPYQNKPFSVSVLTPAHVRSRCDKIKLYKLVLQRHAPELHPTAEMCLMLLDSRRSCSFLSSFESLSSLTLSVSWLMWIWRTTGHYVMNCTSRLFSLVSRIPRSAHTHFLRLEAACAMPHELRDAPGSISTTSSFSKFIFTWRLGMITRMRPKVLVHIMSTKSKSSMQHVATLLYVSLTSLSSG